MSFSLISVHAVQNCLKLGAWAITLSLCVELFVISTVTYICIVSSSGFDCLLFGHKLSIVLFTSFFKISITVIIKKRNCVVDKTRSFYSHLSYNLSAPVPDV